MIQWDGPGLIVAAHFFLRKRCICISKFDVIFNSVESNLGYIDEYNIMQGETNLNMNMK